MAADLQSLRTFHWITLLGSIAGVVGLLFLWQTPYRPVLVAMAVLFPLATLVLEYHRGKLSLLFLGLRRYYRSFPPDDNGGVFQSVKKEYCYLGVGFATVLTSFRSWYGSEKRPAGVRVQILLVDPDADGVLEFQARHEWNLWGTTLSDAERQELETTVQRTKTSIRFTLDTLASLLQAEHPIEVRFHRERLRNWLHIIDGEALYAGLFQLGKDGLNAPVLELKRHLRHWRLFDYYSEQWKTIWQTATKVDLKEHSTHAAAPRSHP